MQLSFVGQCSGKSKSPRRANKLQRLFSQTSSPLELLKYLSLVAVSACGPDTFTNSARFSDFITRYLMCEKLH